MKIHTSGIFIFLAFLMPELGAGITEAWKWGSLGYREIPPILQEGHQKGMWWSGLRRLGRWS